MKKLLTILLLLGLCLQASSQTLAEALKQPTDVNPIIPFNLCADPTAIEYEGRLYVYGTNDQQEYNITKDATKNTYGKITQLVCMSTADLVNWTFHGVIDVKAVANWIWTSWAPSVVSRVEADGETHFYLYFTNSAAGIGVLTATSPLGPWEDPLGHALIDTKTEGRGEQSNIIDPGVCIDDDGNAWLTFGGGNPNSSGSNLMPGNVRVVKLGKDMISLDGEMKSIPAPFHFEANELNYINGKYVFSYCGKWTCSSEDWDKYEGKDSYPCPGGCSILSMTTDDPLNGTWTYSGEILKNPGKFGYPSGNNHSHLQKFGSNYYMLYHTQYLEKKMGLNGGYRGIAINKATVNENTAKISSVTMNNTGPAILSASRPTAKDGTVLEAESMANSSGISVTNISTANSAVTDIQAGDWTMVRGCAFPDGAKSLKVRVKGKGVMEVRLGTSTSSPVATIKFNSTLWTDQTVNLTQAISAGKIYNQVYFIFTEASGTVQFDHYSFSTEMLEVPEEPAAINIDSSVKFQHVTGFGGFSPSPQWSYWLTDSDMDKMFGNGSAQLGLNIVRLFISPNKDYWSAGLANAKRAKAHGAFIFATPWSPPAEWKSNNKTDNGGSLLESHYEDWADFLNEYYEYMKSNGVTIDAVSIQNEPDFVTSYASCVWTGEEMAKFLRLYGHKIKCKIIAPETVHFNKALHEPILNDPEACARLDILGGHLYGWNGSSYPLAAEKGKEVWMTEYLLNDRQETGKMDINWVDDGFLFARSINDCMLANMSAWVHYSLKRYYGIYGDGQFGTTNNVITKRGYVLSQYAKYVSGTTRVRHSLDDKTGTLSSSAYLSQTEDSIVVMLINPSENRINATFSLPFFTKGGWAIQTTASKNAEKTSFEFDEETYEPVLKVDEWSVNTYIFVKSSSRQDDSGEADEEVIFSDDFSVGGGGCIPDGWKASYEGGTRTAGTYNNGPRILSFSQEGMMPFAFYFRTGTSSSGNVTYGEEKGFRLPLEEGKYTLSYSLLGWKVKPVITTLVKVGTIQVGKLVKTPEYSISDYGSSSRITQATDCKIDFEVTTAGNCILSWSVPAATSGMNEALLGNVLLIRHQEDGGSVNIPLYFADTEEAEIYDLQGRRLTRFQKGMNIIKQGNSVRKVFKE